MACVSASLASSSSSAFADTPLAIKGHRGLASRSGAKRVAHAPRRLQTTSSVIQRAEYIWDDGLEGTKGLFFNSLRSKTKVRGERWGGGEWTD